ESRDTIEIGDAEVPLIEAATLIDCPIAGRHIDLSMRAALVGDRAADGAPAAPAAGGAAPSATPAATGTGGPPRATDVMQLVGNHYGLAPRDAQGLDLMPLEWIQAAFPVLARLALRREHSIDRLEAASYRRVQMPSKHDVIKALQSHMATVNREKPSNALLADKVHHCRMQTTHTGEFVKVWLKVDPPELENAVVAALVQLGGKHKHGIPPRSRGARVTQVHLDALEGHEVYSVDVGSAPYLSGAARGFVAAWRGALLGSGMLVAST
ncbi:unnamed protein product, partial [Prorocentrum cordatum]